MRGVHDRLLIAAARDVLRPLGFRQKGRSRLWFADHGWWLIVVEFQPSSWSRGAYLNVAAKWLWSPAHIWTFDYSINPNARVVGFREFETEEQFTAAARELAQTAGVEAVRLRDALPTIGSVADRLAVRATLGGWNLYHAGVAAFLAGRGKEAQEYFVRLSVPDHDDHTSSEWLHALRASAARFAAVSSDPDRLFELLAEQVKQSRAALRLSEWQGQLPGPWLHEV